MSKCEAAAGGTVPAEWTPERAAAFVDGHYRDLYRFLLWLTNDAEAAADLTQESFAAFWRYVADEERAAPPEPGAWLYGIARNRWRKRCRDHRPALAIDAAIELPDSAPGPETALLAQVDAEEAAGAVAALPPEYREALVLRVFQELSYEEIGAALGIRPGLARWRVHQARLRLRAALETR